MQGQTPVSMSSAENQGSAPDRSMPSLPGLWRRWQSRSLSHATHSIGVVSRACCDRREGEELSEGRFETVQCITSTTDRHSDDRDAVLQCHPDFVERLVVSYDALGQKHNHELTLLDEVLRVTATSNPAAVVELHGKVAPQHSRTRQNVHLRAAQEYHALAIVQLSLDLLALEAALAHTAAAAPVETVVARPPMFGRPLPFSVIRPLQSATCCVGHGLNDVLHHGEHRIVARVIRLDDRQHLTLELTEVLAELLAEQEQALRIHHHHLVLQIIHKM
eukprot:4183818-Prymnesium_polylepis.1